MTHEKLIGMPVYEGEVQPEWIDVNEHMNVAYYVLAFDLGVDALWTQFGITNQYMQSRRGSTFAVQANISYLNELLQGDGFIVTSQILGFDEKRIHQFMRLYRQESGKLAATAEWLNLHINLDTRRVSPWPDDIVARIRTLAERQTDTNWPEQAGARIRVSKPLFSLDSEMVMGE